MENFKPGDLVELKSGSATMTVEGIEATSGCIICTWWGGDGKVNQRAFHPDALKRPDPPRPESRKPYDPFERM